MERHASLAKPSHRPSVPSTAPSQLEQEASSAAKTRGAGIAASASAIAATRRDGVGTVDDDEDDEGSASGRRASTRTRATTGDAFAQRRSPRIDANGVARAANIDFGERGYAAVGEPPDAC